MGGIQQVALVSGLCTAGGAYAPTMSDVAVITHRIGNIYLGGPPLVKAATGEVVTGEELGGATLHCSVSGITDHFAKDEEESFAITRDVIASLNLSPTPTMELEGTLPLYSSEGLQVLAGKNVLEKEDVMALLARITDNSRFFEFKAMFGGNLVCGFGRLFDQLTGFLINSGPITAGDSQKGGHFVQLCDNRDIPIVFLQNGSKSVGETCDAVTMKERAKFIQCQSVVRVPRVTLSKSDPSTIPTPPEEAVTKKPRKPVSAFSFPPNSAAWAAARALCDAVVEPRRTREALGRAVQVGMAQHLKSRDSRGVERGVARM